MGWLVFVLGSTECALHVLYGTIRAEHLPKNVCGGQECRGLVSFRCVVHPLCAEGDISNARVHPVCMWDGKYSHFC